MSAPSAERRSGARSRLPQDAIDDTPASDSQALWIWSPVGISKRVLLSLSFVSVLLLGHSQQSRGECTMTDCVRTGQLGRALRLAAFVSVAALLSAPVQAGQCPADKVSPGARTSGEMKPKDVTDNVLGQVELAREKVN